MESGDIRIVGEYGQAAIASTRSVTQLATDPLRPGTVLKVRGRVGSGSAVYVRVRLPDGDIGMGRFDPSTRLSGGGELRVKAAEAPLGVALDFDPAGVSAKLTPTVLVRQGRLEK